MENASKALIMAGGVLVAILIISLGIGLASMMQAQSKSYYETLSTQEITKINAEITKDFVQPFVNDIIPDSNTYITAQGIVTLKNLASKLAAKGINITITGSFVGDDNEKILKEKAICNTLPNVGKINYYVVTITSHTSEGMIEKITIGNIAKNKI